MINRRIRYMETTVTAAYRHAVRMRSSITLPRLAAVISSTIFWKYEGTRTAP